MTATSDIPILDLISDYLFHDAERWPSQVAMTLGTTRMTYANCAVAVRRLSRGILAMGIGRGDRVAMLSTPRPESFLTFLATASIGAIWVGLNPRFRIEEMRFVLADCAPRVLFSLAEFEDRDYRADLGALLSDFPGLRLVTLGEATLTATRYEDLIASGDDERRADEPAVRTRPSLRDPALIVYTSGSTGKPKGALLTHYGLVHSYIGQMKHIGSEPMVDVCNLPINHIGCMDLCCMPLISGGTIHFMERFDAETMLELVERERVSFLGQVPTMYQMLSASLGLRL